MKFKAIHIHNLNELIPAWALDPYATGKSLEEIFSSEEGKRFVPNKKSIFSTLGFWIEIDALLDPPTVRIATPDESVDCSGWLIIKCHSLVNEKAQIEIPLNPIFKWGLLKKRPGRRIRFQPNSRAQAVQTHGYPVASDS